MFNSICRIRETSYFSGKTIRTENLKEMKNQSKSRARATEGSDEREYKTSNERLSKLRGLGI